MTEENSQPEGAQQPMGETLTTTYEHLRHSEDSQELSEEAQRPLPDREDGAAFSRATALLEAVAGNLNTPVEDRVFLATTMPFPNILVKLSTDPEAHVRAAVAGNHDVKDWLAGRLTKDKDAVVREAALVNPKTSWKMRMEGAEDPRTSAKTLDYLGSLGRGDQEGQDLVLSAMVRRAVAENPQASEQTLKALAGDPVPDVQHAAQAALDRG